MMLSWNPKTGRRSNRGFTIVEIGVVVAIIGILAALAMPAIMLSRKAARSARFINDLRQSVFVFESYAMMNGAYPAETAAGAAPVDMTTELRSIRWSDVTPIGGQWDWDFDTGVFFAGVGVVNPNVERDLLIRVDQRIDDGDLSTGRFIESGSGFFWIIE